MLTRADIDTLLEALDLWGRPLDTGSERLNALIATIMGPMRPHEEANVRRVLEEKAGERRAKNHRAILLSAELLRMRASIDEEERAAAVASRSSVGRPPADSQKPPSA